MLLPYSLIWNTSQHNNLWTTVGFCCGWKMGILSYIYSVADALFCEALAVSWWKILCIYWTLNGKGLAMNIILTWGSYWSWYPGNATLPGCGVTLWHSSLTINWAYAGKFATSALLASWWMTKCRIVNNICCPPHETFNSKDCVKWINWLMKKRGQNYA